MSRQNPQPKLYSAYQLSAQQKKERQELELDDNVQDGYDELEIYELIRYINDPEYPLTLQQLNVVNV